MGDEKKPKSVGVWPTVKPFVNGGASGMLATCVIQPIDMVKVYTYMPLKACVFASTDLYIHFMDQFFALMMCIA